MVRFFQETNTWPKRIISILIVVVLIVTSIIFFPSKTQASWFASGSGSWNYRQKITIDHTKVNTATGTTTPLVNFPVLISVTNVSFKSVANGGHVGLDTGYDIVFTSGDGKTKLAHEIEYYASTTGQVVAWVKIPSLSSVSDTAIYMYYGNGAESGNEQNATGVWDSNYQGVWHLPNGSALTSLDSTSHTNNGVLSSTPPTPTTGKVDGAASFGGSSYVDLGTNLLGNLTGRTFEAWVKATSFSNAYNSVVSMAEFGSVFTILAKSTGKLAMYVKGGSGVVNYDGTGTNTLTTGNFYHVVLTYDSVGGLVGYVNGGVDGTAVTAGTIANTGLQSVWIGAHPTISGRNWNGVIDEVRVSSTARSSDWVKTEYLNQNSPTTFVSWGGEETQPTSQTNGRWYNASYGYRKKIVINHTQVSGTSTLANFPVLVSIASDPLLIYTGSGGHVASSTGGDIIFTDSNGTLLNFEREYYASTTGQVISWVQIPSLSPFTDTTIYMYYGNASASNLQNPTGTWDSNYQGVWHLQNAGSATVPDSTSNGYTLTNTFNHVTGTSAGLIGAAAQYDGGVTTYFQNHGANLPSGSSVRTTSCWFKGWSTGTTKTLITLGANTSTGKFFAMSIDGANHLWEWGFSANVFGTTVMNPSSWNYGVLTYDGTTLKVYVNGVLDGSGTPAINTQANGVELVSASNATFDGVLDESRVSNVVRSADWIKTEYNNQSSPNIFETVAGEESASKTTFNSSWYSSDWLYRKPIVIDHTKINTATGGATPLANFPVLVSITDNDLKNYASSTALDIVFTSSDGKTKLNHEIESYNSSTGQLIAWVQVPSLGNTADTQLYMYFGNLTVSDQSNKTATWDSNFKGVYHLPVPSTPNDSTGVNNGTNNGTTATTGQIDGGANFSSQYIQLPSAFGILYNTPFTLSVWAKASSLSSNSNYLVGSGGLNGSTYNGVWFRMSEDTHSGQPVLSLLRDGSNQIKGYSNAVLSTGAWYHIVATYDGSANSNGINIYVNGSSQTLTRSNLGTFNTLGTQNNFRVGVDSVTAAQNFTGVLDEVRISQGIARSADWIKTEYLNQSSPSTFYALGALQSVNRSTGKGGVSTASRGAGNWTSQSGTWTNRRQIIINASKISTTATTTLYGFPMFFSSTDNEFKTVANGGKVGKSDGTDIFFVASDGTTKLAHELIRYNASAGTVIAWVNIPVLTSGTYIYMYYGNPSASDMQTVSPAKALVWGSNYKAVYHFGDGTSFSTNDSTSNGNTGSVTGTINSIATPLGGGADLTLLTTNNFSITPSASLSWTSGTPWAVSLWENGGDVYSRVIWEKGVNDGVRTSGGVFKYTVGGGYVGRDCPMNFSGWHYMAWVYSSGTIYIYKDGALCSSGSLSPTSQFWTGGVFTYEYGGGSAFPGYYAEWRIQNGSAVSADWIKTEYNNQSSPSTFYTIAGSNPSARPANTPLLKSRGGVNFH